MRPVRVLEESVGDLPTLTVQDPSDLQGAMVVVACVSASRGYWAVAATVINCFSQPGCASPGGLYNNRWCGPGKGSYSGARCRTIG